MVPFSVTMVCHQNPDITQDAHVCIHIVLSEKYNAQFKLQDFDHQHDVELSFNVLLQT